MPVATGPYTTSRAPTQRTSYMPPPGATGTPPPGSALGGTGAIDLFNTASGGAGRPVHEPFGNLGTQSAEPNSSGYYTYEGGTGPFPDALNLAATPGSVLPSETRANIVAGAHTGLAAQAMYRQNVAEHRNRFDALGRIIPVRTNDLLTGNANRSQNTLDQGVGRINAFTQEIDRRRNAALGQQGNATDAYAGRMDPVIGDTREAYREMNQGRQDQGQAYGDTYGMMQNNQAQREGELGGIRRGYGHRTQGIGNQMQDVDRSMGRRQTYLEGSQQGMQQDQGLNQANRLREQGQLDSGYSDREKNIMSLLNLRGQEASSDINRAAQRSDSQSDSDLASRGIFNTTVTDSARRGIEEDRMRNQGNLDERLREQEIGLRTQLSGDSLQNQRQTSDVRNQLAQQRLGQSERFLGQRQQAHADTAAGQRTTAGARGAMQADELGNRSASNTFSNEMARALAAQREGQTAASLAQRNAIAENRMQTGGIRAQLSGDTAGSLQTGADMRQAYDSSQVQPTSTMLDSILRTGEGQNAREFAGELELSNYEIGFLMDELTRGGRIDQTSLINAVNSGGSEAPPPLTRPQQTSTFIPR